MGQSMSETCEHGCEGICMLCIREGEGKQVEKPTPEGKTWEECQDDDVLWDD